MSSRAMSKPGINLSQLEPCHKCSTNKHLKFQDYSESYEIYCTQCKERVSVAYNRSRLFQMVADRWNKDQKRNLSYAVQRILNPDIPETHIQLNVPIGRFKITLSKKGLVKESEDES